MSEITHQEIFVHKSGKQYRVRWIQDDDAQSPLEWSDCHGVTVTMDWNPLSEYQMEQHLLDEEPELEEETRLRMLRPLSPINTRGYDRLYYDVMASLELARTEWGHVTPEDCMKAVEQDYAYLKGWYDDEWHWVFLEVTAIVDGELDFNTQYHVGGYESGLALDTDMADDKNSVLDEVVKELEWNKRGALHPGQMELPF
jgi:hypothetical protein